MKTLARTMHVADADSIAGAKALRCTEFPILPRSP